MVKNIKDDAFKADVIEQSKNKLVLVDFWAPWCGPCVAMTPTLDSISQEMVDKVEVIKINIDENQLNAKQYGVRSIPTLLFFKNGELKQTTVGLQTKNQLVAVINSLV